MSILVTTTNTGTFSARARPRCSLVIPTMPALLPTWGERDHADVARLLTRTVGTPLSPHLTISMQKSGRCPVIPNTVVFRYFSCPARSMKVMTFEDFSQILVQSRLPP